MLLEDKMEKIYGHTLSIKELEELYYNQKIKIFDKIYGVDMETDFEPWYNSLEENIVWYDESVDTDWYERQMEQLFYLVCDFVKEGEVEWKTRKVEPNPKLDAEIKRLMKESREKRKKEQKKVSE